MSNNIKISIIVPTYNMGHLINRCLDSLTKQSLQDIEILIIDDASTDNTEEVVKNYQLNDKRIKYIKHKKNQRRGGARNTGIEAAKGDYIGWVDADDWVKYDTYEKMYIKAVDFDCDIVQCHYYTTDGFIHTEVKYFSNDTLTKGSDIFESYIIKSKKGLFAGLCNKIYKRELFKQNNIKFPITYHEDGPINLQLAYYAKKMFTLKEPLYYYLQHDENTSDEVSKKSIEDIYVATKTMYSFLLDKAILDKYKVVFFMDTFFRRVIITKLLSILKLEDVNEISFFIKYLAEFIKQSDLYNEMYDNIGIKQKLLLKAISEKKLNIDKINSLISIQNGYKGLLKTKIKKSKVYDFYKKIHNKFNKKKLIIPDNFVFNSFATKDKQVLLGFDDGPYKNDGVYNILDTLDKYDMKAIFFLNGIDINDEFTNGREKAKEIIRRGHIAGSHCYRHIYYEHMKDIFVDDIKNQNKLLIDIYSECGIRKNQKDILLRMPYLNYFDSLDSILNRFECDRLIHGSPVGDWIKKDPNLQSKQAMKILKPGQIYVLHNRNFTYKWLDIFLKKLKDNDYSTVVDL